MPVHGQAQVWFSYYVNGTEQWKMQGPTVASDVGSWRSNGTTRGSFGGGLGPTKVAPDHFRLGGIDGRVQVYPNHHSQQGPRGFISNFENGSLILSGSPQGHTATGSSFINLGSLEWLTEDRGTKIWTSCAVHPHKMPNGKHPYMVYLKNLHPNPDMLTDAWRGNKTPSIGREGYNLDQAVVYQKLYGTDKLDGRDGTFHSNFITLSKLQELVGEDSDFPLGFGIV